MSKISEKDVQYVAELANLELTAEEQQRMVRDMNSILGHIDKLNELDTTNVEPMAQVMSAGQDSMRADEVRASLDRGEVMKSAPDSDGQFFRVPKVIEK